MERKMMFVGTCLLALIVALAICVPAAFADEPTTRASGASEVDASATLTTEASPSVADEATAKSVEGTKGSGLLHRTRKPILSATNSRTCQRIDLSLRRSRTCFLL